MKKYDLRYFNDLELKSRPRNTKDMTDFINDEKKSVDCIQVESLESLELTQYVSRLGTLGNYLKMLDRFGEAQQIFAKIDEIIQKYQLPEKTKLVNQLRWADNYRYSGDFSQAQALMEDGLAKASENRDFSNYIDFALQHLGKLYFDQKKFVRALVLFGRAIQIRKNKEDEELLVSSIQALEVTRSKLNRICVIGNSCSGKTTLSKQLKEVFNLPLHHADSIQYLPGLVWRDPSETRKILTEVSNEKRWIIEGLGPLKILEERMQKSDLILVLRPPIWILYIRLVKRQFIGLFKRRPELPVGCFESTPAQTIKMVQTIWNVHHGLWAQLDRIFAREVYKDKLIQVFREEDIKNLIISYAKSP